MTTTNEASPGERPRAASGRSTSLLPREHGAYAQVIFPILTVLALAVPKPATLLLAVTIAAGFLVHEPVVVLLGQRGARTKRELGDTARQRVVVLSAVGAFAGIAGLWLAPQAARLALLVPGLFTVGLVPFVLRDQEKTLLGEVWAAGAFSSTALPLGLASGVTLETATITAITWWVCFVVCVFAVQGALSRTRRGSPLAGPGAVVLGLLATVAAIFAALEVAHALPALAILPVALIAGFWGAIRPHPRGLRKVGWSLVSAQVGTFALLVALGHLVA
jgi:hypothetical protein